MKESSISAKQSGEKGVSARRVRKVREVSFYSCPLLRPRIIPFASLRRGIWLEMGFGFCEEG